MIHHVFANRSNIGDWLSALGIQSLLAPLPVVEHLCDDPFIEETLAELARTTADDIIVIGGGGLFMDYLAPFWDGLARLDPAVAISIWGVGLCDLKREPSRPRRRVLDPIVRRAEVCIVRDDVTHRFLGDAVSSVPVACPSLAAVHRPASVGWGLLVVDNYNSGGPEAFEAMTSLGKRYADRTGRPYRRTNNRIEPSRRDALASTLDLYAASDLVVSSALHGCVIGVAMGRKVLAVSGDHKIEGFMESIGLGAWVIDHDDLDALPGLLDRLPSQPSVECAVERSRLANRAVADRIRALAVG